MYDSYVFRVCEVFCGDYYKIILNILNSKILIVLKLSFWGLNPFSLTSSTYHGTFAGKEQWK